MFMEEPLKLFETELAEIREGLLRLGVRPREPAKIIPSTEGAARRLTAGQSLLA
jgi:hypothetical protein